jgi:predicted nuclease of predicted toxin-antitoxin system
MKDSSKAALKRGIYALSNAAEFSALAAKHLGEARISDESVLNYAERARTISVSIDALQRDLCAETGEPYATQTD